MPFYTMASVSPSPRPCSPWQDVGVRMRTAFRVCHNVQLAVREMLSRRSRLQNHTEYRDQTDIFFESPISYMKTHFPAHVNPTFPLSPFPFSVPNATFIQALQAIETQSGSWDLGWQHEWPRYLVFFGALLEEPGIRSLFGGNGYVEVWRGGWQWQGEGKRTGGVRVWAYEGMANTNDNPSWVTH